MASLTAHLLETGDHGRLGFHPSCPVCRQERLFGPLSSGPVVSRRTQAALASGVLALSTAAPGAAMGQEPDNQSEGTAAPEQPSAGEVDNPGFDPGGDTALPFEAAPVPTTPQGPVANDPDESVPLETEPTVDPDARLVPDTEPEVPMAGPDEPVPSPEATLPGENPTSLGHRPESAPLAPQPGQAPSSSEPSREPQRTWEPTGPGQTQKSGNAEGPSSPSSCSGERRTSEGRSPGQPSGSPTPGSQSPEQPSDSPTPGHHSPGQPSGSPAPRRDSSGEPPSVPAPPNDQPHQVSSSPTLIPPPSQSAPSMTATAEQAVVVAEAGTSGSPQGSLSADTRFYVVTPGDSLWSIAKRLLGSDAPAALVAREVNRLWTLNRDRIGTGDPDLVMVGTKLRLR
jgi:hypothetical protein